MPAWCAGPRRLRSPPEGRLDPGHRRPTPIRHRFATGRRNRWVPILRLPWTTRLCQSRSRRPPRSRARRSGSGCSSSTWSGARPISGSPSRSTRSRRSSWPRPASSSPAPILLAWSIAREGRSFVRPEPARMARQRDRRSAAAGRREWAGRIRRTDGPVGDRGAPGRDDAGLGGDPRAGSSSAIGCRGWRSSGSRSASPASRSSSVRPHSVAAGRSILWASPPASSPRSRGREVRCSPHGAPSLPGRPLVATGLQMRPRRAGPRGDGHAAGEPATFDPAAVTRDSLSRSPT